MTGYIRPEIMAFAEAMETTLRKHDHKGGWDECTLHYLIDGVHCELKEADEKWDGKNFRGDYGAVADELIDVANFCMMFWGNTYRHEHGRDDPLPKNTGIPIPNNEQEIREKVMHTLTQGRKVITLCGSVKFWDEYKEWNARLTLEGNIVFSCGLSLKEGYEDIICDLPMDDVKTDLDCIHLRKIDLSDEIFVLNVGGYIGESTRNEIAYAESKGKKVRYLESLRQRNGEVKKDE